MLPVRETVSTLHSCGAIRISCRDLTKITGHHFFAKPCIKRSTVYFEIARDFYLSALLL